MQTTTELIRAAEGRIDRAFKALDSAAAGIAARAAATRIAPGFTPRQRLEAAVAKMVTPGDPIEELADAVKSFEADTDAAISEFAGIEQRCQDVEGLSEYLQGAGDLPETLPDHIKAAALELSPARAADVGRRMALTIAPAAAEAARVKTLHSTRTAAAVAYTAAKKSLELAERCDVDPDTISRLKAVVEVRKRKSHAFSGGRPA